MKVSAPRAHSAVTGKQTIFLGMQVRWAEDGMTATLRRLDMSRKRMPLTKAMLKNWLQEAADCQIVQVFDPPGTIPLV